MASLTILYGASDEYVLPCGLAPTRRDVGGETLYEGQRGTDETDYFWLGDGRPDPQLFVIQGSLTGTLEEMMAEELAIKAALATITGLRWEDDATSEAKSFTRGWIRCQPQTPRSFACQVTLLPSSIGAFA